MANNNCSSNVPSMCTWELFIRLVTHGHYNVRNSSVYLSYHILLLYSHGVITVIYDLQIFSCPTNGDVTRVHCVVTLETGTSSVVMTFDAICRRLDASCAEVTFGSIYLHAESPPSDPRVADFPCKKCEGVSQVSS
jgi:hypothetical protein